MMPAKSPMLRIAILAVLAFISVSAMADHIKNFDSKIKVNADGSLLVIETITVRNGEAQGISYNDEIKRGIYKTFPLKYRDTDGFYKNVSFDVKSVTRNGNKEPYHTKSHANGIVLYIGDKDVFLEDGDYIYVITYETNNQLGFFNDHDELYYNAIGTDWNFFIESATCDVELPAGAVAKFNNCYTGYQGSRASDCKGAEVSKNHYKFATTGPLETKSGFTIVLGWQKGIVAPPSRFAKIKRFVLSNWGFFLMMGGGILAFFVNLYFWFKVGKDPKKGIIYPQFEPPANMGPAAVGYVVDQKFSNTLIAATIVDWAVNHYIKIEVGEDGIIFKDQTYTIRQADERPKPTTYENLSDRISPIMNQTIGKNKYLPQLAGLKTAVQNHVEANYIDNGKGGRGYFSFNIGALVPGYLIVIGCAIGGIAFLTGSPSGVLALGIVVAIVASVISQIFFSIVMKAYNPEGRKIADYIEGFKMYLSTAEGLRFDKMNPPDKTLELYEKYLPFAIALGVENRWAAQFETQMAKAIANNTYHPTWYSGRSGMFLMGSNFNAASFASGLSSNLSSNISSSVTPPGSSSGGGGGGGFSGGGGGGGGGGGW